MLQTIEDAAEKRCCSVAESILEKKDKQTRRMLAEQKVSDTTVEKVNEMVEARVRQLKTEIPQVVDYAKMKKLMECVETIKECVGYRTDEQIAKMTTENAKAMAATRTLIETQAKQIQTSSKNINESNERLRQMSVQMEKMKKGLELKDKQIAENVNKNRELANSIQSLQKRIDDGKKLNESIEQKRKDEALRYYLETRLAQYPKYEASLLREHFKGAKSRAEIDEAFESELKLIQNRRDSMRKVSAIPVAKVNENKKENAEPKRKKISGGETIVGEQSEFQRIDESMDEMMEDSVVEINDSDVINPDEMQLWISRL